VLRGGRGRGTAGGSPQGAKDDKGVGRQAPPLIWPAPRERGRREAATLVEASAAQRSAAGATASSGRGDCTQPQLARGRLLFPTAGSHRAFPDVCLYICVYVYVCMYVCMYVAMALQDCATASSICPAAPRRPPLHGRPAASRNHPTRALPPTRLSLLSTPSSMSWRATART
jgi:hypothetical protein